MISERLFENTLKSNCERQGIPRRLLTTEWSQDMEIVGKEARSIQNAAKCDAYENL